MGSPGLPKGARIAMLALLLRDGVNLHRRSPELAATWGVHVRSIQRDLRQAREALREVERLEALWKERESVL